MRKDILDQCPDDIVLVLTVSLKLEVEVEG